MASRFSYTKLSKIGNAPNDEKVLCTQNTYPEAQIGLIFLLRGSTYPEAQILGRFALRPAFFKMQGQEEYNITSDNSLACIPRRLAISLSEHQFSAKFCVNPHVFWGNLVLQTMTGALLSDQDLRTFHENSEISGQVCKLTRVI